MAPNLRNFALQKLKTLPNLKNNPMAQNAISAIENNDNEKGEEIANNLCESYGVSKDEAMAMAKEFFHIS